MTTLNSIGVSVTASANQSSAGLLERFLDWMNQVADAFFGPAEGDARRDNPAEAYLLLNPSCCGAIIDTNLWDLLIERPAQPELEEANNV